MLATLFYLSDEPCDIDNNNNNNNNNILNGHEWTCRSDGVKYKAINLLLSC